MAANTNWFDLLRYDLIPVASVYVGLLALMARYRRERLGERAGGSAASTTPALGRPPSGRDLLRHVGQTAVGGYLFLLLLVLLYHVVLGGESWTSLTQAATGGALLAFLAVPALLSIDWLSRRVGRGRREG